MYRSTSQSRIGEEYYAHAPPPPSRIGEAEEFLPIYDPPSNMTKKDKSRAKFADNAIHIIPLVLLVCGLILWLFSNPDVDVGLKVDSITSNIEGLTIEGDIDSDSDGTQTGFLPVDVEEAHKTKTISKISSK
uniref:Transmembrane protein n=1 Tax=Kalanchoe fedtschenkoi TaxID=63787 RepID=A0A7N0TJD7_KALFE